MRPRVLVLLVLLCALLAAAPAGAATRDRCAQRGASTVEQQGAVRVLRDRRGSLFSCYRKGRPRFLFEAASNEDALGLEIAGGRYLTFVDRRIAQTDGLADVSLEVIDVRRGRRQSVPLAGDVGAEDEPVELALTPSGVAAVLSFDTLIVADVARRRTVIVARGNDIAEVAAGPRTIYWTQGGAGRSTSASAPVEAPTPDAG